METNSNEIAHDFQPFFKVFKDSRIERCFVPPYVPPGIDPKTGLETKDIIISPETGASARLFLPKLDNNVDQKLPLVVHFHGGAFCLGSAFDTGANTFSTSLAIKANAMVISVDYRLAPEQFLPAAHDDCSAALQWIADHSTGSGPEPWINQYANLERVFLAGESAGANLAHYVAVQAGVKNLTGLKIVGMLIVHPFFACKEPDMMIKYLFPTSSGADDDPYLNPAADPNLVHLGCKKVLVFVAEKDSLKERGLKYYESLKKSGWDGSVELVEDKDEDHCFHLFNPDSETAAGLIKRMADFISQGD